MTIPYQIVDVRFTQSHGWVMDCFLNERCILPVSIPFNPTLMYEMGWVMNIHRATIKNMFELELNRLYNERMM
jgi:hypothetical protein